MRFTTATDDLHCDVHGKAELVAAIRSVEAGRTTIITLHRAKGITRYIFNWRGWHRPSHYSRKMSDREVQHAFLWKAARYAQKLPKEYFQ